MSCESEPHHASSNLKFRQASGRQRLISNSPLARPGCLALETNRGSSRIVAGQQKTFASARITSSSDAKVGKGKLEAKARTLWTCRKILNVWFFSFGLQPGNGALAFAIAR
jgi:hypothetical protein